MVGLKSINFFVLKNILELLFTLYMNNSNQDTHYLIIIRHYVSLKIIISLQAVHDAPPNTLFSTSYTTLIKIMR